MGLAEKRVIQAFQNDVFPGLKKEVDTAAGFDVPIEVAWDLIGAEGKTQFSGYWKAVYFEPLTSAFKMICADQMGRDALKKVLKKIVLTNTKSNHVASKCASLVDGTLTIDHDPGSNVQDVKDRTKAVNQLLENSL